ncbi:MAG: PrgI family protein [bacterium]|nr:PrgI family protein [bacterium]
MQQFQVPQFIDIEDKILGPLTVKQLIYVLGGAGFVVTVLVLPLPRIISWILAAVGAGFFASVAFLKINGQPAITVLNNMTNHVSHSRLFIWKHSEKEIQREQQQIQGGPNTMVPKFSKSKLQDLSWSLDINEKLKR